MIELADGQSFAIAGLLQENARDNLSKYPGLGNIPILGTLFRSRQFQKNETELIIIVTVHLVKPIDPEVFVARTRVILDEQAIERRKREIREQINALRNELRNLEDQSTPASSGVIATPEAADRFLKRGRFVLDLQAQRATLKERVLSLPPTAFTYLTILARHAPNAVDYQTLVTEAQGYAVEQSEASELAKYHIHVLRQAISVNKDEAGYILNVRGVGYRLLTD